MVLRWALTGTFEAAKHWPRVMGAFRPAPVDRRRARTGPGACGTIVEQARGVDLPPALAGKPPRRVPMCGARSTQTRPRYARPRGRVLDARAVLDHRVAVLDGDTDAPR
jgi:hypothetical protein